MSLADRRRAREPLAYILGRREFFGLDFFVDCRVLVPRPETESLVEQVLAWNTGKETSCPRSGSQNGDACAGPALTLADVGTGSGCIAIAMAVHLSQALVYALDSSLEALEVAAGNVARHGVAHRVRLLHSHLLGSLLERVDGIVANPPYVRSEDLLALEPEVRDYEPRLALDGGPDGLSAIRELLAQAPSYLRAGGLVLMEIGWDQGAQVTALAHQHFPGADVTVLPDYAGHDRILRVAT